ncbi:hypothetical protein Moror_957 [Moniliophthora roreri MCA 2997]|uniref:Uncharacterized protein n=1 Tax=Moniliophthora roreri (strain MCA 2997) TaxID=1381753 RepID=V2X9R9_MONRO|nr:hypothetical protein Moror_957 [Moniliophthora roreri MCA 2997]
MCLPSIWSEQLPASEVDCLTARRQQTFMSSVIMISGHTRFVNIRAQKVEIYTFLGLKRARLTIKATNL